MISIFTCCISISDLHGKQSLYSDSAFERYNGYDMIDPSHTKMGSYRFSNNHPFPHIRLKNFLEPKIAEMLYDDFPPFESGHYLNEFGRPGGKSTQPNLKNISLNYKLFHSYIGSPLFLSHMSAITGIPNLLNDPYMFGAGTHENRHGQALNIHVDFNYNRQETWHRRVNLLLYLNKEWDSEWGGLIEFHSNPWSRQDEKKQYDISFNSAVIRKISHE